MKYGIQLFSLRKYLKDEAGYCSVFRAVKDMGAETVQISCTLGGSVKPELLRDLSAEYALPICVTHSPYERIVNDIDTLAKEHLEFGCRQIGVGMMPKEFRANGFEKLDEFISALNTASQRLKDYSMSIAYHNHWFEFEKIDNQSVFDRLISDTEDEVQFIPDTFWIKVGGEEPAEFLKRLNGRVTTLHLKDYKKTLGVPVFRALGKGELDFDGIVKIAEGIGVQNCVAELDVSPNPMKSAAVSMEYLKRYIV